MKQTDRCLFSSARAASRAMNTALVCTLFAATGALAVTQPATHVAQAGYRVVHGWPVLPEGQMLGWVVSGVGVDSRGNVLVLHRADREWPQSDELDTRPIPVDTVVHFDGRTGRVIDTWGANRFAMPHGLTVDHQDNVWITDVAFHQVYKCSSRGELLLTLGQRGVPGGDRSQFNRPTKVAVSRDGSVYVSDGYRNNRVVSFTGDGRFRLAWGSKGSGPAEFDLPHGIAVNARGRVFVADRSNARVQIFDANGRYLAEWKGAAYGRPFDIAIAADETAFIADGGDIPEKPPDRSAVVVVRSDDSRVERFGQFGLYDGQFYRAHALAVGGDGSVYVGDAGGRVQKFVRTAHQRDLRY